MQTALYTNERSITVELPAVVPRKRQAGPALVPLAGPDPSEDEVGADDEAELQVVLEIVLILKLIDFHPLRNLICLVGGLRRLSNAYQKPKSPAIIVSNCIKAQSDTIRHGLVL